MKRFGPIWNENIQLLEEAKVPVGRMCAKCDGKFKRGDQGLIIPYIWDDHGEPRGSENPWHLDCFLESIGVNPCKEVPYA